MLGQVISRVPHSISQVRNGTAKDILASEETRAALRIMQSAEEANARDEEGVGKKAFSFGLYTQLHMQPVEIQAQCHYLTSGLLMVLSQAAVQNKPFEVKFHIVIAQKNINSSSCSELSENFRRQHSTAFSLTYIIRNGITPLEKESHIN